MINNLYEFMKDDRIPWLTKMDILTSQKMDVERYITDDKPYTFIVDYPFTSALLSKPINIQWKELDLAIKVLEFTRIWFRHYVFEYQKMLDTKLFMEYFSEYINLRPYKLQNVLNINYAKDNGRTSIKTMLKWALKLYEQKMISKEIFNNFCEYLEII